MWFRAKNAPVVSTGTVLRSRRAHRIVEIVEVLGRHEVDGLPHVHYRLSFQRPGAVGAIVEGERTIALDVFLAAYSDQLRLVTAS